MKWNIELNNAYNHGAPWLTVDLRKLNSWASQGQSWKYISGRLNRSIPACKMKWTALRTGEMLHFSLPSETLRDYTRRVYNG